MSRIGIIGGLPALIGSAWSDAEIHIRQVRSDTVRTSAAELARDKSTIIRLRAYLLQKDAAAHKADTFTISHSGTRRRPETIATLTVQFRILLGSDPVARPSENSMLPCAIRCDLPLAAVEHAALTCTPDGPVVPGVVVSAAGVAMTADMRAGGTARLTGRFDRGLTANYVDPSGNRYRGEWDEDGNLVNASHP